MKGSPAAMLKIAAPEEGEHEDHQQHEDEPDVLGEVVEDLATLLDGVDDGGEIVVGEDHAPGVLGHLGPRSHGDADVGRLDGGRVVDAVPRHGHHLALPLQGVDQQDLVLGSDPAHDPDVVDPGQPISVGEGGEVGSEHRLAGDTQLLGDRRPGGDVVAGDHAHADVGGLRLLDGGFGFSPGRIDHPDKAGHLQVVHVREQIALGVERGGVDVSHGGGHDALPESGHPLDVSLGPGGQVRVPGNRRAARECRGRATP